MAPTVSDRLAAQVTVLRGYLPYLMLLVSVVALAYFLDRGYYAFVGPVGGAVVGSVLAVLLGNEHFAYVRDPIDARVATIGITIYVVALIWTYRITPLYTRPTIHYVLFGGAAAFLGYQIWVGQPRRHVIPQLLVMAALTYWSTHFAYPAGVISPDSGFIGTAGVIAETGFVPEGVAYQKTPAHMIYAAIGILVTGLLTPTAYQVLSVIALLVSIAVIGLVDKAVPGIDRRMALFGALIFATMSFTLRRGMFPDKTNYFKPFLAIFVLIIFYAFYQDGSWRRYAFVGFVSVPVLVFGHLYSAGTVLLLIGTLWGFRRIISLLNGLDYQSFTSRRTISRVFVILFLALAGYSLAGGFSFISRLAALIVSLTELFAPAAEAGGTTGGRYSSLSLRVLLFSTTAQAILFALAVAGIGIGVRRRDWSLDAVIAWIIVGMGFLAFSVFGDAVNIPTPRIYLLLVVFGLNVMAALGLFTLADRFSIGSRKVVIGIITFCFVAFALASPVGSVALSPVGDEVPGKWRYETSPGLAEYSWAERYATDDLSVTRSSGTTLPIRRTGGKVGVVSFANLSDGTPYEFQRRAKVRGVRYGGGSASLGGNQFLFLHLPSSIQLETKIYSNGQNTVFIHRNVSAVRRSD